MGMSEGIVSLLIVKWQAIATNNLGGLRVTYTAFLPAIISFFMLSYFRRKRRPLKIWTFGLRISTHQDLTLY